MARSLPDAAGQERARSERAAADESGLVCRLKRLVNRGEWRGTGPFATKSVARQGKGCPTLGEAKGGGTNECRVGIRSRPHVPTTSRDQTKFQAGQNRGIPPSHTRNAQG